MTDSERNLLTAGILLGSILSLLGNILVTSFYRRIDGKKSLFDYSLYLVATIGFFGISLILVAGYIYSL